MQDELKKVISQAMNTNFEFEQEPTTQFAEAELSDEALETVAGGIICSLRTFPFPCKWRTLIIPKAQS